MSLAEWWAEREPRERLMVGLAAMVLIGGAGYSLGYEPAAKRLERLEQDVAFQRDTRDWLAAANAKIQGLGGAEQLRLEADNLRLQTFVQAQVANDPISASITVIQREGDDVVRMGLENADFEKLLQLINRLGQLAGTKVDQASLRKGRKQGLVSGNLRLTRL